MTGFQAGYEAVTLDNIGVIFIYAGLILFVTASLLWIAMQETSIEDEIEDLVNREFKKKSPEDKDEKFDIET